MSDLLFGHRFVLVPCGVDGCPKCGFDECGFCGYQYKVADGICTKCGRLQPKGSTQCRCYVRGAARQDQTAAVQREEKVNECPCVEESLEPGPRCAECGRLIKAPVKDEAALLVALLRRAEEALVRLMATSEEMSSLHFHIGPMPGSEATFVHKCNRRVLAADIRSALQAQEEGTR